MPRAVSSAAANQRLPTEIDQANRRTPRWGAQRWVPF